MKYPAIIIFSVLLSTQTCSQHKTYAFYQLYQLDSIGNSPSIGRHFGELYFYFLELVEDRLENADTATQRLVRHFETVFAQFYIDACIAYRNGETIPLPAWRAYFKDSTLSRIQYNLMGANAHLNGGLAEAIAGSYSPVEWEYLKKRYKLFNKCLNITFRRVHKETFQFSKGAKTLRLFVLGLDRYIGSYFLYKWRKRQMRLTEYYYTGSPKYKVLLAKINRKKENLDHLIRVLF